MIRRVANIPGHIAGGVVMGALMVGIAAGRARRERQQRRANVAAHRRGEL